MARPIAEGILVLAGVRRARGWPRRVRSSILGPPFDPDHRRTELDDYEAIRRLIALYGQLLDSKRFDEWGDLFTGDARFRVWGQCHIGRDAIAREICGMQPEAPGKHVVLCPVIDLDDAYHARSWTDLSAFASSGEGFVIATIGRYHDRLVKDPTDQLWRFAERTLVMAGESAPEGVDPSPAR